VRTLAIIPARGGSRRLPGKNLKPFLGRPLIQWTVEFALRVQLFSRIVVSTDSDSVAQCAADAGVPVRERRPAELATDAARSVDVAIHELARADAEAESPFDLVALLQPTSPLRNPAHWSASLSRIAAGECAAVVGVSAARPHPAHAFTMSAGGELTPWAAGKLLRQPAQELEPAVAVNGSLYVITAETLRREQTFFPPGVRAALCAEPWEGIDLDTEADWVAAEAVARFYGVGQ
jgi:CMP-N-acetylneuraminic acid synthetase